MIASKSLTALALAMLLSAGLSGCATDSACAGAACGADAAITIAVKAELAEHSALQSRDLSVQTIDHVVYLRGLVDTDLEREEAEAAAHGVAGVVEVVNSIVVRNGTAS
ncbi:MAG: BON domain-containing protein [Dokdonella sp.]